MSSLLFLLQQACYPIGGNTSQTPEKGFMPVCTPGPLAYNDAYSCDAGVAADWIDLLLTSELRADQITQAEYVDIDDRGHKYRYGYISVHPSYHQPLDARTKQKAGAQTLDPAAPPSSPESPMQYYSPWKKNVDCANAVYKSVGKMGRRAPRGDGNSLLKPWRAGQEGFEVNAQTGRTELSWDQRVSLLNFIEENLSEGHPIMAGVDYTAEDAANNLDQVTDHWLLITNRRFDEKGQVYFYAIDNAAGADKSNAEIKLYVSPDLHIWKAPGDQNTHYTIDYSYLVTNARAVL